jgi:hypothetical protein
MFRRSSLAVALAFSRLGAVRIDISDVVRVTGLRLRVVSSTELYPKAILDDCLLDSFDGCFFKLHHH